MEKHYPRGIEYVLEHVGKVVIRRMSLKERIDLEKHAKAIADETERGIYMSQNVLAKCVLDIEGLKYNEKPYKDLSESERADCLMSIEDIQAIELLKQIELISKISTQDEKNSNCSLSGITKT